MSEKPASLPSTGRPDPAASYHEQRRLNAPAEPLAITSAVTYTVPINNTRLSSVVLSVTVDCGTLALPVLSNVTDPGAAFTVSRSEEHTSELQSLRHLVCR